MLKRVRVLLAVLIALVGIMGTMAPSGVSAQQQEHWLTVPAGATLDDLVSVGANFTTTDGNECSTAGSPRVAIQVGGDYIFGYFGTSAASLSDCGLVGANLVTSGLWEAPGLMYVSFADVQAAYSGAEITQMFIVDEPVVIEDLVPFVEWVAPPAAASVAGQVFEDGTGTPLVGADVCIVETGQCTVSGAGGYYAIGGVFNGFYSVTASLDGYVSLTLLHEVAGVNAGPTFYLVPAQPEAASVTGQVLEDQTGEPLVGATVCIDGTELCTTSVEGGYYAIGGVFNGDYFVTASMPGYSSQTLAHSVAGANGGPDFFLDPLPTSLVTVTVLDENGAPLPGADVAVYSEFYADPVAVGVTDADGNFQFGRVQYHTYTVQAIAEGYDLAQGDYVADAPDSFWQIQLTLQVPQTLAYVNVDPDVVATFQIFDLTNEEVVLTETFDFSIGDFNLGMLPSGDYVLSVEALGYEFFQETFTVTGDAYTMLAELTPVAEEPEPQTVAYVNVDPDVVATFQVFSLDNEEVVLTDTFDFSTGDFYLGSIPSGEYVLSVDAAGYEFFQETFTVTGEAYTMYAPLTALVADDGVTMNIWKFVCSGFSEQHEDGCVESEALNGTDVEFTVSYTIGDDVTTVETSLEIQTSEGSAVLNLPLADSYTVCEMVPEGVTEVVFNVAGIDEVVVSDGGCITFSGESLSDGDVLNIAFWNIVPTDDPVDPVKPVKPTPAKPGKGSADKPAAVTSLPETGSGSASVATAPIMLIAAAAAAAGAGAILRKER